MTVEFRYLNQEDVARVGGLDMGLALKDVEEVFRLWADGECILPSKVVLRWGDADSERESRGHINAMPGYVGGQFGLAGIKWISGFYSNPIERGMPAIAGLIVLNDAEIGGLYRRGFVWAPAQAHRSPDK